MPVHAIRHPRARLIVIPMLVAGIIRGTVLVMILVTSAAIKPEERHSSSLAQRYTTTGLCFTFRRTTRPSRFSGTRSEPPVNVSIFREYAAK